MDKKFPTNGSSEDRKRLSSTWAHMKDRCYNPDNANYKYYGACGIDICPEWLESLETFQRWALSNGYAPTLTIERRNVYGDYEPDNCTWTTKAAQAKNRLDSILIKAFGEVKILADWIRDDRCKVQRRAILKRITLKWSPERAISTPSAREAQKFALVTYSPEWTKVRSLALDAVSAPESKRAYSQAIDKFMAWVRDSGWKDGFNKACVNMYKSHLLESGISPSTVNVAVSAIRRLAVEAGDNGLMDPVIAAGVSRAKSINRGNGVRTGNWLTKEQAEKLINSPDISTLKGRRDRAMLALMIGSGLRRNEIANLDMASIQQREGRWIIVDLVGKGKKVRSVPIPSFAKAAIDEWFTATPLQTGKLFRPINKGDKISGDSMVAQSVFETVKHYAALIGHPNLAPHDLRRTFAKLAHNGRAALEQIQLSLGHSSIQTTERYLGVRQDLTDAPCDHLGLKI